MSSEFPHRKAPMGTCLVLAQRDTLCEIRHGQARHGRAGRGKARLGEARQGKEYYP
jgi:hypothetical protein